MVPDDMFLELVEAVGLERGFTYTDNDREFRYCESKDKTITTRVNAHPGDDTCNMLQINHPAVESVEAALYIPVDSQTFIERTRAWYHDLWEQMVELRLTDEDAEHRREVLSQQHVNESQLGWIIDKFGRVHMTALLDPIKWEHSLPTAFQLSRLSERDNG